MLILSPRLTAPRCVLRQGGGLSGPSLPSSLTRFSAPSDMTFSGSNIVSINDRIIGSPAANTFTGVPTGDNVNGLYFDTTTDSRWNKWNVDNVIGITAGKHYAYLIKRKLGSTFTTIAPLTSLTTTGNRILAQNGSTTAGAHVQNVNLAAVRGGGVEYVPANRDELYDNSFTLQDTWMVVMWKDLYQTGGGPDPRWSIMSYSTTTTSYQWEGWIAGFAEFTDWSQADAVETALLSEVP